MLRLILLTLSLLSPAMLLSSEAPAKNNINNSTNNNATRDLDEKAPNELMLGERPKEVQKAADHAFGMASYRSSWGRYNGTQKRYEIMVFDEETIIRDIATNSPKKDVYFIDVGAGQGDWGQTVVNQLQEEFADSDKHFHVLSLTGGMELQDATIHQGNTSHYKFAQFKIENITSALKERGLKLDGCVDLIVSHWTLRHLVDPVGTVKQLYNLLSPNKGVLLGTGFWFYNGSELTSTVEYESWKILALSPARSLFRRNNGLGHSLDEFMLMRCDERPFEIPVAYTGKLNFIPDTNVHDCASGHGTVFKSNINLKEEPPYTQKIQVSFGETYYGNKEAADLVTEMKKRKWFFRRGHSEMDTQLIKLDLAIRKLLAGKNDGINYGAAQAKLSKLVDTTGMYLGFCFTWKLLDKGISKQYDHNKAEMLDLCRDKQFISNEEHTQLGEIFNNEEVLTHPPFNQQDPTEANIREIAQAALKYKELMQRVAERIEDLK